MANAYPFLMLMGKVILAWLLLWEAGVAKEKLDKVSGEAGVDPEDGLALGQLIKSNIDAAFCDGKIKSARYYVKHVLPELKRRRGQSKAKTFP